jgi:hypothetical protein
MTLGRGVRYGSALSLRAYYCLAAVFALIAILFPNWGGLLFSPHEIDFRYFWFAGYMWAHGLDPYSPTYAELGNSLLPVGSTLQMWLYPPDWWLVARALALLDLPTSLIVWRFAASGVMILATAAVTWVLTPRLDSPRRLALTAFTCALASVIEPTRMMLSGQVSSVVIYAGVALVVCAEATRNRALLVAGLILLTFKPQVGAVAFVAFAIADPKVVLYALIGCLILALPQFISFGFLHTIQEMIGGYPNYAAWPGNSALAMTGPAQLLGRVGIDVPALLFLPAAFVAAIVAGVLMRREGRQLPGIALLLAGIAAFVPLHNYDMELLLILAILLVKCEAPWIAVAAATLLIVKPGWQEKGAAVYANVSQGAISYTIAALIFLALAIRVILRRQPTSA